MSKQNKTLRIIFVVLIGFLILISVLTFQRLNSLYSLGQLVNQTTHLTIELEKTVSSLKDAEIGYRDYLLSQDQRFLEPVTRGLNDYPLHLKKIKELIPDYPDQQDEFLKIENLISNHHALRVQKLKTLPQVKASADELTSSKMTMDSLLFLVDNLITEENSQMKARSQQLQKHSSFASAMILLLSFLAFMILIVSFWQLTKSNSQTQYLQDAIVKQNVQLEKKKELQNVFKQAPVPIAVFRKSEFFVEVINDVALQLLNKSLEEVIDKPIFEIAPNLKELLQPILQQVLQSGETFFANEFPIQFDHQGQPYDGYFDLVIQPALDEKGNRSGLIAIGQEVTESVLARKQIEVSEERYRELSMSLEEKVIARTSELKKEKDFSETIIDTSLDLIVVYDVDMRMIVFNKSCEDFFKFHKEDVLGKTFVEVFPRGKDTPGHQDLKNALKGQTIHNKIYLSPIT